MAGLDRALLGLVRRPTPAVALAAPALLRIGLAALEARDGDEGLRPPVVRPDAVDALHASAR